MSKEYIERGALKEDLKESYDRLRAIYDSLTYDEDKQICAGQLTTFTEAILRVKNAPAADVAEVRHGWWERVIPTKSAAKWSTKVSCSNCHSVGYMRYNYCPNCGASMDKGQNEK